MNEFLLTPEELALLLSIIGRPEAGQRLMATQLGEMTEREAEARLQAAGHALIARGWLALSAEGPVLESSLARMLEVLSRPAASIRYSRATREAEFALVYHLNHDAILEHRLEQGIAHHLTWVPDSSAVVKGGLLFFGLPPAQPFTANPIQMAERVLMELKDLDEPAAIAARLWQLGIAEEDGSLLAEDLAHPQYRGSALRIQYDDQGIPHSEKGFLLLRGPQRLWLISLEVREPATATLVPATVQAFHEAVTALL